MKRICLIIVVWTALLYSCDNPKNGSNPDFRGVWLYPVSYNTHLCCIADTDTDTDTDTDIPYILLNFSHDHATFMQWQNTNDFDEYLEEQWEQHINRPLEREESATYVYGHLTNMIITADCEIVGKAAGENLADLFSLSIGEPSFRFPNGEWVDFPTGVEVITLEEFIDGNYICPNDLYIYSDIGKDTEEYKVINISVVLTLSDGTNEKTLTSSCTLKI